ncbi:MAG TPA: 30S ribosomal protein S7 [Candidatus Saccharimonadia bacterium]|nr:30S ribosomal protein S7 [Candidatus Saccharimonadia bacterium]
MARQAKPLKRRDTQPDMKFGSTKVTKLINRVMKDGEKTVATKQVYAAFELLETRMKRNPLEVYEDVLRNITPAMEVRSRRVGGAAYQVPMPVRTARGFSLAIRWLVDEARKRPNGSFHTFAEKLAAEMMDSLKNEGGAMNKKLAMHRTAEANKAFAHFRW